MAKKKVVHIVEALGGGVYTYFKNLSHFFGNENQLDSFETYIVYSSKRRELTPENIHKEFSKKVHLIETDMTKELSPIQDFKAVLRLRKIIKEINPDIIHLHSSKAGVLGRIAVFSLFQRKKVYYTPHGYAFLRLDISKTKRKMYYLFELITQKLFGGTTIACGDTEHEIAKKLGKSELIRNGVFVDLIAKNYQPNSNSKLTIGIVGRITFQKNPTLFNEIANKFPQYDFVWIGDGELRDQITSPNIHITGWFSDNEATFPFINSIDVFLQTSLWEGLPLAVLEAMAMQKPVVTTNVIGNKDAVEHRKTGFIFNSIEELDSYFKELEEAEFRKTMGENALKLCKEKFNLPTNFQQLAELYKH